MHNDGKVGEFRTMRRLALTDPRRWDKDVVKDLNVTPWRLQDPEVRAQAAAATTREPSRANLIGFWLLTPAAATARAERIVPLRQRPSTPGCAACAKRGLPNHGFRHSVECKRRKQNWLETRLGPPVVVDADLVPSQPEVPDRPTKRLREKTTVG